MTNFLEYPLLNGVSSLVTHTVVGTVVGTYKFCLSASHANEFNIVIPNFSV